MDIDLYLLPLLFSFTFSILFPLYCFPMLLKYGKNGQESLKPPPGNTGLPLIGEILDIISTSKNGVPERFVLGRVKKYSSEVFKTSLFGETMAIFSGPEGNKFLFLNKNKLVRSWWPRSIDDIFGSPRSGNASEIAVTTHKPLSPNLGPGALENFISIMDSATKQHLRMYWEGRDVVTVYFLAKHCICALVCMYEWLFIGIENQGSVTRFCERLGQISDGMISLPVNLLGKKSHLALKAKQAIFKDIDSLNEQWKRDF